MTKKDNFVNELAQFGINETRQMTAYYELITSLPGLHNLTGKEIARVAALMSGQKHYGYEQRIAEELAKEKQDKINAQNSAKAYEKYRELKTKHPDTMLLVRRDDSYEAWGSDASDLAMVIGSDTFIEHGILKAGFYFKSLDVYLPKLIRTGHRVAICEGRDLGF